MSESIDPNDSSAGSGGEPENRPASGDREFLVAALLLYVAKGDGNISDMESGRMLQLLERRFRLSGAAALELLTRAMDALDEKSDVDGMLSRLGRTLSDADKEDIAVMLLQVVAADGERDATEMEKMDVAAGIIDISPEVMHQAFTRYFEETSE